MFYRWSAFICICLLLSCTQSSKRYADTTTSGTIVVAVDESLYPLIEAQKVAFEYTYPKAKLNIIYTDELTAMHMVATDSARIAVITREFKPEEKVPLDQLKITPRYTHIANDALAIIIHPENPKQVFTLEELNGILSGKVTSWHQLDTKLPKEPISVVFDNPKSGAVRMLTDSVLAGNALGSNCYALRSNPAVIDHVAANKMAIGIIGVAWVSDKDDSSSVSFLQQIAVAKLVPREPEKAEEPSMKPYQAYVALKQYPLWRKVMIVSRETHMGLGTGFASYVASDKGQRIVLKMGLVPALAPIRLVEINNQPLNIQ